ncbi:MAG: chemotaxis protein CheR, partial [Chloroflexi bacterium]
MNYGPRKEGRRHKKASPPAKPQQESPPDEAPIIVGIGASAGGLKAFEQFFTSMPAEGDLNVAFVLVQHLDPTHKSILTDLIKRYTKMKVFEVKDGVTVQANCAYIIPPNKDMAVLNGKLHLMEPETVRGMRLPIDYFFRSLAQDAQERAICIVLAGTGTDGTLGLKAVKGAGGMVMVQTPESAQYDGMPRNAIGTGLADYILPPNELPAQLLAYIQQAFGKPPIVTPPPGIENFLQKIFVLLRAQTGHDFSYYKKNTIRRRIERRMVINQIEHIEAYVHYLQENPLEVDTLFKELLIGVTNFFRDPDAFEVLLEKGVAQLLDTKPANHPIRVWVAGCSTGEEAYSIAILLRERLAELKKDFKIQIFATDIDAEAIAAARTGVYPDSIAADVSAERLARFFYKDDNTYRIKKSIRDMVVFAEQNVIDDPPFSKMDLISCRNLLIYLESELQKRILPLFHYALNENGFLLLGNSETIGEFSDYFAVIDRKWKLFQRKGILLPRAAVLEFKGLSAHGVPASTREKTEEASYNIRDVTERTLLNDYTPAGVVINDKGDVLYIHGRTGKYLEPASGQASLNILRMARLGLRLELSTAIRQVI